MAVVDAEVPQRDRFIIADELRDRLGAEPPRDIDDRLEGGWRSSALQAEPGWKSAIGRQERAASVEVRGHDGLSQLLDLVRPALQGA